MSVNWSLSPKEPKPSLDRASCQVKDVDPIMRINESLSKFGRRSRELKKETKSRKESLQISLYHVKDIVNQSRSWQIG